MGQRIHGASGCEMAEAYVGKSNSDVNAVFVTLLGCLVYAVVFVRGGANC